VDDRILMLLAVANGIHTAVFWQYGQGQLYPKRWDLEIIDPRGAKIMLLFHDLHDLTQGMSVVKCHNGGLMVLPFCLGYGRCAVQLRFWGSTHLAGGYQLRHDEKG